MEESKEKEEKKEEKALWKRTLSQALKIGFVVLFIYIVVRYVFMPGSLPPAQLSFSPPSAPRPPDSKIGHLAPPLVIKTLEGKTISIESLRGKVVLLNFFGTWCPPCRFEMPAFDELYREFSPEGFTVVAVAVDGEEVVVKEFAEDVKVSFSLGLAPEEQILRYRIHGLPTTFILDRRGVIREIIPGAVNWHAEVIKRRLKELLSEGQ